MAISIEPRPKTEQKIGLSCCVSSSFLFLKERRLGRG